MKITKSDTRRKYICKQLVQLFEDQDRIEKQIKKYIDELHTYPRHSLNEMHQDCVELHKNSEIKEYQ